MFVSKALGMNKEGNLTIGNADTTVLAKAFGTPLYVMDEGLIIENINAYKSALENYYGGHGMVFYASKAFLCKEMARIVARENIGLDVVSGGEMYTALAAQFPPLDMCLHGNNKDISEITVAIEKGVGRIVADSAEELDVINRVAGRLNKKQKVLLRIRPGVAAHTHEFVQTGQNDSKFGVSLESGEAMDVLRRAQEYANIELSGIHSHIGSQILDGEPFCVVADIMVSFMAKAKNELGMFLYELNLGGGFGIKYTEDDKPKPYKVYMKHVIDAVTAACDRENLSRPFLMVEPGRSIVGSAGITLYEVGAVKEIPDVRKYVCINGGMGDNPRYIMYGAKYDAVHTAKPCDKKSETITIAGKCCESGDIIIKDAKMPPVERGDIIAVTATGAFNYSMASNYNRIAKPAVVMVRDGVPRIIVKRESLEDLVRNDL